MMYSNLIGSVSAIALATLGAHAAYAQETEASAIESDELTDTTSEASEPVTDIVVTGSRIGRRDFTSASPIVTTNQAALQASGQVNIESALGQLPQFTGARNSTTSALGGGGFATVNLRGLGENRNLVLLDGRRLPQASGSGVTDLNILPQSLIGSVEVISGGASAVYGSDAVSGVVNFKSRDLTGFEVSGQASLSDRGDASVLEGSLSFGSKFADDRGRIFLTGSYTNRDAVFGNERSFYTRGGGSGSIPAGAVLLAGPAPTQAAVDAVFARYGIAPGTVSRTSRFGFNNDGTLFAVTNGVNLRDTSGRYGVLGGQTVFFNVQETNIVTPQERYNAFGKLSYELTPEVEFYAQGLYARSKIHDTRAYPVTAPIIPTIPLTNPFIPADLREILASRTGGTISLFKAFQETGHRTYLYDFEAYQFVAGARGSLGGDWKWDIYGATDKTKAVEEIDHVVLLPRVQRLLNAPDGGNSICAGGYNPFSEALSARISQACLDFITAPTSSRTTLKQNIIEASANGSLFNLPAGPVKLAVTAGYRENRYRAIPDILLIPNYDYAGTPFADLAGTRFPNGLAAATNPIVPASGKITVKEISGELLIPVFDGKPFAESLNITLGARYSDYNLAGGAFTYKGEIDWRPIPALLLRGGYERAIRAPNVAELFGQIGTTVALGATPVGGDPCDVRTNARTGSAGAQVLALCQAQFVAAGLTAQQAASALATYNYPATVVGSRITGNRELDPEKADTFTVGAVVSPHFSSEFVRRATLSVDYYNIKVEDSISTISGATSIAKCFNLDGSNPSYDPANGFCSTIVRSQGTGILFDVGAPYLNIGGIKTSGLDIQLDTEFALGGDVRFGINSVVGRLFDYKIQALPDAPFQNFTNTVSANTASQQSLPRWKALTTATLSLGETAFSLRWRFIGAMKDVSSVVSSTPAAGVDAYHIFDMNVRVPVGERFELRAGVNNLFDKKPPIVGGVAGQTNASLYDIIGRSFFVGARARF